jgi:hypothetical protein
MHIRNSGNSVHMAQPDASELLVVTTIERALSRSAHASKYIRTEGDIDKQITRRFPNAEEFLKCVKLIWQGMRLVRTPGTAVGYTKLQQKLIRLRGVERRMPGILQSQFGATQSHSCNFMGWPAATRSN